MKKKYLIIVFILIGCLSTEKTSSTFNIDIPSVSSSCAFDSNTCQRGALTFVKTVIVFFQGQSCLNFFSSGNLSPRTFTRKVIIDSSFSCDENGCNGTYEGSDYVDSSDSATSIIPVGQYSIGLYHDFTDNDGNTPNSDSTSAQTSIDPIFCKDLVDLNEESTVITFNEEDM